MEYMGYLAKVIFDEDSDIFHGDVINIKDTITFEADCVADLRKEFRVSVDEYIKFCEELGEEPSKPFSGKFVLRLDPNLHREVAVKATLEDKSLNGWIVEKLEAAVSGEA